MENPELYIIAGCNGAGKTTASFSVLPQTLHCQEFVNADEIARGLSPFHPEDVAVEAGRLMLKRIGFLLSQHSSFAIETTLATRSYQRLVRRAQQQGYKVILLFFWLESPYVAEQRVAKRVREGGHNIPKDVIHRRYWSGLNNLFSIYMPIVDAWSLYDNNKSTILIADTDAVVDQVKFETIRLSCQNKND
jgi:predicted ABC-type ATPase